MWSIEDKDQKNEKVEEFVQGFHEHGIGCGLEISKLAREMHPGAIAIIPNQKIFMPNSLYKD